MPRTKLDDDEVLRLLASAEVVRVAFRDGESTYLIPLGCVCIDGDLYGVADPGRKTELAQKDPRVAFQVDSARRTGLFEWDSVTGEGEFSVVQDPAEKARALAALQAAIASAPEWWRAEQAPRMAAGRLVFWRIEPSWVTGVRYAPSGVYPGQ